MEKTMRTETRSIIELHCATVILGMTALFAKFIHLPSYTLICLRSLLTAVVLGIYIYWMQESLRFKSNKEAGIVLLLGLLLSAHWVTYFYVLQIVPIAVGVISFFTFPVMTSLIEPLLYDEKWDKREIVSVCMILLGVYIIVPDFTFDNTVTWGVAVGLFSALLFSFRNILTRKYASSVKSSVMMFYQTLITGLSILPFIAFKIPEVEFDSWWKLMLLATVFTAFPHTMVSNSFTKLKVSAASIIMSMQPLYATLLAAWLLHEFPALSVWIGGTLVGGAVMFETWKQSHHK